MEVFLICLNIVLSHVLLLWYISSCYRTLYDKILDIQFENRYRRSR